MATIIIFFVVSGLIWVRKWLTERKLGMTGKFPSRAPMGFGGGRELPSATQGTEMWSDKAVERTSY